MSRRGPALLVVLAATGLIVSSYLAAVQLRLITAAWDPLFGSGSERVLFSPVSRLLPVPDATLGAMGYALEGGLGLALLVQADRAQAGLIVAFTLLASLAASVAVALVVLQPLVAHALCTLCLVSAALSVALALGAIVEARDRLEPSRRER